ncbi:MAG: dTDP-glucose 4,6-dehydratase [Nitrospirota bacterium]
MATLIVTGGAGFIGSNFILQSLRETQYRIINIDNLTYAANPANLKDVANNPRYVFVHGDITDSAFIRKMLSEYQPEAILNFSAETHVDRSISGPEPFIQTNIVGAFHLLEESVRYFLANDKPASFRFFHISTDEVYGSLDPTAAPATEQTAYQPNSPYAASKAAADHLVRAYYQTYGLPTLTTNCSNNYGPYQYPEKLIPLMIIHALQGKPLPIYGDGGNIRDWLYVGDHCAAIQWVLEKGAPGETYNISARSERNNLQIVKKICEVLDQLRPQKENKSYADLISFVTDRLGHDRRYALDPSKLEKELGWRPQENFDAGLEKTVCWYLDHPEWIEAILKKSTYQDWMQTQYQQGGIK